MTVGDADRWKENLMLICLDCPLEFNIWENVEYLRHNCAPVACCVTCRLPVNPAHQHISHYNAHGFLEPGDWD